MQKKSASWILGQILQASIVSELGKLLCRCAKFHLANSLMVTKLTKFRTTFCLWERYFEQDFWDFVCGSEISIKISFTISFAEITQGSQNAECGLRKGTANWWRSMLRQSYSPFTKLSIKSNYCKISGCYITLFFLHSGLKFTDHKLLQLNHPSIRQLNRNWNWQPREA